MKEINPHQVFAECFDEKIQGVARALSQRLSEGHICIDIDEYDKKETDKIHQSDLLSDYTDGINEEVKPFVLMNNKIYLRRYFKYETTILEKINSLLSSEDIDKAKLQGQLLEKKKLVQELFAKNETDKNKDNWQMIGAISAFLNRFTIITGGPGTGKTTTVAKLLTILYSIEPELKVALAAPTGKAAARINETLKVFKNEKASEEIIDKIQNLNASSIHRLMGGYQKFEHNQNKLLPYDVIIIDESSMIDAALLAKLMCAVNDKSRLIMLGDSNQLSSVEAGSIFGDLCQTRGDNKNRFSKEYINYSNQFITDNLLTGDNIIKADENLLTDCIVELEYSHRFENTKGIGKFSKDVINGIDTHLDEYKQVVDIDRFVKILAPKELNLDNSSNDFTKLIEGFRDYINKEAIKDVLNELSKVKVLCAIRDGKYGVYNLNQMIEKHLGLKKENEVFYHNQPILITANNKELGIFNGDIGIIRKNTDDTKMAYFEIDGEIKAISLMYITDYETAFAMTIHKSQGSEYTNVAVVLTSNEQNKLLSRELLYTAVTRAKEKVFIYSSDEILKKTIATKVKRVSGITIRLQTLKK